MITVPIGIAISFVVIQRWLTTNFYAAALLSPIPYSLFVYFSSFAPNRLKQDVARFIRTMKDVLWRNYQYALVHLLRLSCLSHLLDLLHSTLMKLSTESFSEECLATRRIWRSSRQVASLVIVTVSLTEFVHSHLLALVVLNEEWELKMNLEEVRKQGFELLHLSTPDYFAPSPREIQEGID